MKGVIQGVVTHPDGTKERFTALRTIPVKKINGQTLDGRNAAARMAACDILNLVLGPLDLDLLGLLIHLNRVVLDIVAVAGAGNLLGNLLCAVAGLLDGGPLGGSARAADRPAQPDPGCPEPRHLIEPCTTGGGFPRTDRRRSVHRLRGPGYRRPQLEGSTSTCHATTRVPRSSRRARVDRLALSKVKDDRYPSATMLDLLEQMLTPEELPAYASVLIERIANDRLPERLDDEALVSLVPERALPLRARRLARVLEGARRGRRVPRRADLRALLRLRARGAVERDAPELWRRTRNQLARELARLLEVKERELPVLVSYVKVAEFQRRGALHFHCVLRLDGLGEDGELQAPAPELRRAAADRRRAGGRPARLSVLPAPADEAFGRLPGLTAGRSREIRWGSQVEVRELDIGSAADGALCAGYIAKYATKSTEAVGGLMYRLEQSDLEHLKVRPHIRRYVECAWRLGRYPHLHELRLRRWAHQLGFRGHSFTKSRRYSTTFTALRQARHEHVLRRLHGEKPATRGAAP